VRDALGELRGEAEPGGRALPPRLNDSGGGDRIEGAVDLCKEGGLTQDDVKLEALSFADLNAALAGGALAVAIQLEPLAQAAVAQGIAVRWRGLDEIYPNQQVAVVAYGPSITVDNPALGRAFMMAYLKGVRDSNRAFTTGEGRPAIAAAIAKYSTVKDPRIVEAMVPVGLHSDGHVNVDSLIEDQQFYVEKATVATPIDLDKLVDRNYVDTALAQLTQ
jgi:NitT/TauT family transport system substrate-binding protein